MCHFPPRKRQHSVDSGRAIRASHASTFSSLDFVKFLLPDTVVMIKNIFSNGTSSKCIFAEHGDKC